MKYMGWGRIDLDHAYQDDVDEILTLAQEEAEERERNRTK